MPELTEVADESDGFEYVTHLLKEGLSAAEAVDYYAVEECGYSQLEWAETRGTSQQAVSKNIRQAKEKLHDAHALETIVVDPEDVLEMMRRNHRDETEQRSHGLRVTPPLVGERKAELHVSEDHSYYPPDVKPKPIHLRENHIFEGRAESQLDPALAYPDLSVERSIFREEYGLESDEEVDEEEWDEWWDIAMETFESNVRAAMREPRTVELGTAIPEYPTTSVEVRFESD